MIQQCSSKEKSLNFARPTPSIGLLQWNFDFLNLQGERKLVLEIECLTYIERCSIKSSETTLGSSLYREIREIEGSRNWVSTVVVDVLW